MRECPRCGGLCFDYGPWYDMWECLRRSCGHREKGGIEMSQPPSTVLDEARRHIARASGQLPSAKVGEALVGIGYALVAQAEALERIADVLVTEQMNRRCDEPIDNQRT